MRIARSTCSTGSASISRWDERLSITKEPSMPQSISQSRLRAFRHQNGCCFCCAFPMWHNNGDDFAATYGISKREARRFQCTAEHLAAVQEGGTDAPDNIVVACWFCNQRRHRRHFRLALGEYRELVIRRIKQLRWHPKRFHHISETFRQRTSGSTGAIKRNKPVQLLFASVT